jgi:hypothetical protein
MATEVSVDDRFRIQDVLRSYVWANDSGDVVVGPDGSIYVADGHEAQGMIAEPCCHNGYMLD